MSRHRNFWLASIWQWLHDPSLHQLHLWRKKRERELGECQGTHFGGNSIHCFVSISNQTQTKHNTTLHWLARGEATIFKQGYFNLRSRNNKEEIKPYFSLIIKSYKIEKYNVNISSSMLDSGHSWHLWGQNVTVRGPSTLHKVWELRYKVFIFDKKKEDSWNVTSIPKFGRKIPLRI